MSIASILLAIPQRLFRGSQNEDISEAVYRDLVATIFTMRAPIIGLGVLYALVGCLILSVWPDPVIAALTAGAIITTTARAWLLRAYLRTGMATLPLDDLIFGTSICPSDVRV